VSASAVAAKVAPEFRIRPAAENARERTRGIERSSRLLSDIILVRSGTSSVLAVIGPSLYAAIGKARRSTATREKHPSRNRKLVQDDTAGTQCGITFSQHNFTGLNTRLIEPRGMMLRQTGRAFDPSILQGSPTMSNLVEATSFGDRPHTGVEPGLLAEVVVKLLDEAGRALDRDSEAARSGIARAVALLTAARDRSDRPTDKPAGEPSRGGLAPWQIGRLKAYIEAHLDEAIRIEDLTVITRLSPSYFSSAFRRSFGETPHAYLVRRRIVRAQELMLMTDEPLSQIAIACGLCDQAHLSKLFRRAIKMSPNLWRRERRSAPPLAFAA
jgi:AraC family transcriptional regulator